MEEPKILRTVSYFNKPIIMCIERKLEKCIYLHNKYLIILLYLVLVSIINMLLFLVIQYLSQS